MRAANRGKERNVKTFINLLKDDSGASAAEYALILAIVGTAIAAAAIFLGDTIATAMSEASQCIATDGSTCP
jgi:pilus assembly protein Flp/PilA